MTNSKSTKRALFSSVLAILVCVAMLIGTTFAWFTDTASTSINKIQAGNLDVALEMYENGKWVSAEGKTLNFVAKDGNKNILWEPGCTYELPALRVANKGNLALKYTIAISGINGDAKLNEAIEWTYVPMFADGTFGQAGNALSKLSGTALYPEDKVTDWQVAASAFKISGHMKESAGNEYQGLSIDGIAITVYATQFTYENDSNGNQYDKDAKYLIPWDGVTMTEPNKKDGVYHITNAAEFAEYITALNCGTASKYTSAQVVLENDIDLNGHTFEVSGEGYVFAGVFDGNGHTVSNYTIKRTDDNLYTGLFCVYPTKLESNTATIKNLTVINGTVIGDEQVAAIVPSIYEGSLVDNCHAIDCTVIGEKKVGAVTGYAQTGGTVSNCSAKGCNIYAADSRSNQASLFGYNNGGTFTNNTDNGGNTVTTGVAPTVVSSVSELKNALAKNDQKTNILLSNDITVTSNYTPIDFGFYGDYTSITDLTINGNGHTISGLTSALVEKVSANCSLTINNLTVKGASISNSSYTNGMGNGILIGYVENGTVTLDNCHVTDSGISESDVAAAALIGYIVNGSSTTNNSIVINDCTVKNTVVNGESAAGFVGYAQGANITVSGCKVSGSTFAGEKTNKQGAYFGTVNVGTVANISNTTADTTALVGRTLGTGTVNYK